MIPSYQALGSWVGFILLLSGHYLIAQEKTCYYLSLSEHFNRDEVTIPGFQSCLTYEDRYGTSNQLLLTFADERGRTVGHYTMSKSFGSNEIQLDLNRVGVAQTDEAYSLSFTDDIGQKHRIPFHVKISDNPKPTVDIQTDAVALNCESATGSVIHYYGDIQGGKAPYRASWKVLDESGKELYQPRKDKIAKKGYTPTITVESTPTYYVALEVRDACGETAQQVVNVQCDGAIEKSNTLFFKSIRPKQKTSP